MYYLDEKEYVTDQWKDIEGFLYYFDSDGIMATGELKQEGQTYTCHDTKGYLKISRLIRTMYLKALVKTWTVL